MNKWWKCIGQKVWEPCKETIKDAQMFGQMLPSTFQWTFSTFCHFCTSLYFVIAVHSSVSDQKRFKWGCVRNAFPRIWCTNSYIAREALAKRCHGDKCARNSVNPNLLKALREINGWSGSGVARTVSCFALRSSLIAIKSCFTFWCFSPGFRRAREDLTATLMPSLRGLSITPTHTRARSSRRWGQIVAAML